MRSKYFICKSLSNPRRTDPRVAIVISKKVMKSAVRRNRIGRRMYEAVRGELPRLKERSDVVFIIVSPEVLTATPGELTKAVQSCLAQADLYKPAES